MDIKLEIKGFLNTFRNFIPYKVVYNGVKDNSGGYSVLLDIDELDGSRLCSSPSFDKYLELTPLLLERAIEEIEMLEEYIDKLEENR